jgi:hypothetical protein
LVVARSSLKVRLEAPNREKNEIGMAPGCSNGDFRREFRAK